MPRYIVQSVSRRQFLAPDLIDGTPVWVDSLRDAGGGVVPDMEMAIQLIEDNTDFEDQPVIIDLDVLGTARDYEAKI